MVKFCSALFPQREAHTSVIKNTHTNVQKKKQQHPQTAFTKTYQTFATDEVRLTTLTRASMYTRISFKKVGC